MDELLIFYGSLNCDGRYVTTVKRCHLADDLDITSLESFIPKGHSSFGHARVVSSQEHAPQINTTIPGIYMCLLLL